MPLTARIRRTAASVVAFVTALVATLALAALPAGTAHAADDTKLEHRPIVFVHGYRSPGPGVFGAMMNTAKNMGYKQDELFGFDYSGLTPGETPIQTLGEKLRDYIAKERILEKSPDGKLDIVAHSMGGLVSRSYLVHDGGAATTKHYVALGTPQRGTIAATAGKYNYCAATRDQQCIDMSPDSTFLQNLNGRADKGMPGPTQYSTFRSNVGDELIGNVGSADTDLCDGVVFGVTTDGSPSLVYAGDPISLPGARNWVTPCVAHSDMYDDAWTKNKTLEELQDGSRTPQHVRNACTTLDEQKDPTDWIRAHTQACVTRYGDGQDEKVVPELRVRGCGYYYYVARFWAYVKPSQPKYPCNVDVRGAVYDEDDVVVSDFNDYVSRTVRAFEIPLATAPTDEPVYGQFHYTIKIPWHADKEIKISGQRTPII